MRCLVRELDDEILTLTLNRPEKLNALSAELFDELDDALASARDADVRVVVLAGAGRAFCAGADVGTVLGERDGERARGLLERLAEVLRSISSLPKPVIAAIHGHTAGGGAELAVEADIRIAAPDVRLWLPDVSMGSTPTSLWHLVRLLGRGVTNEMAMLGRRLGADELVRFGVVSRVVDRDELLGAAQAMARQMRDGASARSLRHAKEAMRLATEVDRETDLRMNIELMLDCARAPEQQDAVERFVG